MFENSRFSNILLKSIMVSAHLIIYLSWLKDILFSVYERPRERERALLLNAGVKAKRNPKTEVFIAFDFNHYFMFNCWKIGTECRAASLQMCYFWKKKTKNRKNVCKSLNILTRFYECLPNASINPVVLNIFIYIDRFALGVVLWACISAIFQ